MLFPDSKLQYGVAVHLSLSLDILLSAIIGQ